MPGLQHDEQSRARVLEYFAATGRIDKACELAGVARGCHYMWLRRFPDYARAFQVAKAMATQVLVDEATRRAVEGVERPTMVAGQVVMVREYSDRLLEFLIKGQAPEIYGDRFKGEISARMAAQPKPSPRVIALAKLFTMEQLQAFHEELQRQIEAGDAQLLPAGDGEWGS